MTLDESRMREPWQNRAPAMLRSPEGPDGEPCPTPMDRRWLWRIEAFLAVYGTTDAHRAMSRDLREYLNETCEHVWREEEAENDFPAHRQCLWCNDIEGWDEP
jgi:hypothetical protein